MSANRWQWRKKKQMSLQQNDTRDTAQSWTQTAAPLRKGKNIEITAINTAPQQLCLDQYPWQSPLELWKQHPYKNLNPIKKAIVRP